MRWQRPDVASLAADTAIGLWVVSLAIAAYVLVPGAALGRPPRRAAWWPDWLGGLSWATLTTIVLVPVLSRLHLLNWATALLVPLAWPVGLWLYRYRGAPTGEFRLLARNVTLSVLSWRPHLSNIVRFERSRPLVLAPALGVTALVFWPAVRELRFQMPAEYGTLADARDLLNGGQWTFDAAAAVTAVLSHVSTSDPMQVLRFIHPLLLCGCAAVAALLVTRLSGIRSAPVVAMGAVGAASGAPRLLDAPASNGMLVWLFLLLAVALLLAALERVHRRDWWHVIAASLVAASAFASTSPGVEAMHGYVEYDAAARQALRLARTIRAGEGTIVAPPEQRVEVGGAAFLDLGEFVRRYGERAASRQFRFDLATPDVYVFVEKRPLSVPPAATLVPVIAASEAYEYQSPNARAHLELSALELCEGYRGTHAQAGIYYEDAQLRVYHFRQ
jgi:hypothetical protein